MRRLIGGGAVSVQAVYCANTQTQCVSPGCVPKNRLERGGLPFPLFLSKVMNYYGDEKRRDLYGRSDRGSVGGIGWIGVAAKKVFPRHREGEARTHFWPPSRRANGSKSLKGSSSCHFSDGTA